MSAHVVLVLFAVHEKIDIYLPVLEHPAAFKALLYPLALIKEHCILHLGNGQLTFVAIVKIK